MNANPLEAILERGGPLVVLSPHLDDAALSCGAMMIHACQTMPVTVATLFTEAGQPPYTLSARRYLHQVGAKDAAALYRQRREEDRAALQPLGITCVHAGLVDAPFRRQPGARARSWWARLMPELAHIYPIYRLNITSGRIAQADAGTLRDAASLIQRLAAPGPALVLAPLGVGRTWTTCWCAPPPSAAARTSPTTATSRTTSTTRPTARSSSATAWWRRAGRGPWRPRPNWSAPTGRRPGRCSPAGASRSSPRSSSSRRGHRPALRARRGRRVTAASAVQPAQQAGPAAPGRRALAWAAVGLGLLAAVVRLALIPRSFDLFGDEVIYSDLGHSVTNGGFPRLQGPFFLHGPASSTWRQAGSTWSAGRPTWSSGSTRCASLNALLAGATAVVLVLLAARAGSLRAGLVSGLLFALDPFCIRQNDRVLLETALLLWVLLGYLVLAPLAQSPEPRHARARAAGAGLLFGVAWLTKDEGALLTVLPLLAAAVLGWGPRRSLSLLAAGVATAVYAAYVGVVALGGEWSTWWFSKTAGARRMLGVTQTTGFNSKGAPSLAGRLSAEATVLQHLIPAAAGGRSRGARAAAPWPAAPGCSRCSTSPGRRRSGTR